MVRASLVECAALFHPTFQPLPFHRRSTLTDDGIAREFQPRIAHAVCRAIRFLIQIKVKLRG
jgi:hypothetical protein